MSLVWAVEFGNGTLNFVGDQAHTSERRDSPAAARNRAAGVGAERRRSMTRDTTSLLPLLKQAATLKAAGYSWDSIALQVHRAARTVRQWPDRYPDQWARLL